MVPRVKNPDAGVTVFFEKQTKELFSKNNNSVKLASQTTFLKTKCLQGLLTKDTAAVTKTECIS